MSNEELGGKGPISNVGVEGMRPPTSEEMAREKATREPRTVAVGSTPEGGRTPLFSAAEFNGTWSFCCIPAAYGTATLTNDGDDVTMWDLTCCFVIKASQAYARIGNSNRFWSTFYKPDGGRHDEVMEFTSPTKFRREGAPLFGWKSG